MPKLLSFLPCLKAVLGDDSLLTVVSILEFISVSVRAAEQIPEDAGAQLPWQMASIWYAENREFGLEIEQTVELISPDGASLGIVAYPITLSRRIVKFKVDGGMFPVGLPGEVVIRVGWKRPDAEDITTLLEFPVLVKHVRGQSK